MLTAYTYQYMMKELYAVGRLSASLGILWALAGCTEMAAADGTGDIAEAQGAYSTDENGPSTEDLWIATLVE